MQRRRFKQTTTLEERLAGEAKRLREDAKSVPPGAAREAMLRKARQAETGAHFSEWLRSPDATSSAEAGAGEGSASRSIKHDPPP
ncbi:hypothetical protein C2U70_20105 [Bradyrhizobium guangdongense]|uniref:hypothetical protein n=1 Tax=Bradyrhizobium guangdongense TaxID=1325090 RepID=UPI001125E202|nr:hypothetical protein [Bradyrhizobium guangdongense]TPQ33095.1 hypothetical protein C2U70_20105 [Bradyrhizobium guangdongense]